MSSTRQCKIFNNWLTRVLLICFLALVGIGGLCRNPYTTNPNLRLLAGDTVYHSINCTNPVVSPDGNVVYYLCVNSDSSITAIGDIYSINIDGTANKKILDGKFDALSISVDGRKLAAHSYKGNYFALEPESLILIISCDSGSVGSLWVTPKWISKIEWNSNGEYLYYNSPTTLFRFHLSDSIEETLISMSGLKGFDLFNNDSIYLDSNMMYFQIEPNNQQYTIGTYDEIGRKLLMRNLQNNTLDSLPDSLIPYSWGVVSHPYWFSDGNTIIFSAKDYIEGGTLPGEIWILENLFEQIEE